MTPYIEAKKAGKKYHYHFINPRPWDADGDADGYRKRCKNPNCPQHLRTGVETN